MDLLQKLTKMAEQKTSEGMDLEALANSIPHMVWVADSAGQVFIHNQQFQDYTGLSNDEMNRSGMSQYLHPEDKAMTDELWNAAINNKETYKVQYRLKRRDGQYRWNLGMALPLRNRAGAVELWFGTCTDIHDQKTTEEKLRQSEERYAIAFNSASIGAWEWDPITRTLEATDTFYELFGLTAESKPITPEKIFQAIHPDDHEKVRTTSLQTMDLNEPFTCEFRVVHLGGIVRWVAAQGRCIVGKDGKTARFLGVSFDVTKRVEDSQSLKSSEAQFRQLAEAIPNIVWQANPRGGITYVSKQWAEHTGQGAHVALGSGWLHFVHPEDQLQVSKNWQECVLRGVQFENEFRLKMKEGDYRWYLSRLEPVRDKSGHVQRWFGTSTDIHIQKEFRDRQRILNEASQLLASSIDYKKSLRSLMRFVVRELGELGSITLVEPDRSIHFSEAYGLSLKKEMILQETLPDFFRGSEGGSAVAQALNSRELVIRHSIDENYFEEIGRSRDHIEALKKLGARTVMAAPLLSRGKLIGVWCVVSCDPDKKFGKFEEKVFKGLTERVSIAVDNALLFEEARRANELKSAFLANISHEIRSPLAAILGFTELLREGDVEESEKNQYLEVIHRNGLQLQAVINDILDLSKVEAGHMDIEYVSVDLREIIQDVIQSVRVKAQAKDISLETQIEPEVPRAMALDPVRVKQIVTNLVVNAVNFTANGGVKVIVESKPTNENRADIMIRIIDTGVGIASEKMSSLFQPFVQAEMTTSRQYGGTGLGLTLSRKLAQAMNGDVWLESSQLRKGSEFCAQFKNVEVMVSPRSAHGIFDPALAPEIPADALRGVRVLVVDDSADNQNLIRRLLAHKGASSDIASNGSEAIEKALNGNYDLVLCDLQMPIMDGYTATRKLRDHGYKKPIVALTAHAMAEIRQKCLEAGCTDHLPKPIHSKSLYETIFRCLS